jgi:hypothetical protein
MNYYNSQTTAHAQYLIALAVGVIGVAAILYQVGLNKFFKLSWSKRTVYLYIPLSVLVSIIIFVILRTTFWAYMGSEVIAVPNNMPNNVTTPLYVIQNSVINKLLNQQPGWTSIAYSLNQRYFGISLLPTFLIVIFYFLLADFFYFYIYKHRDFVLLFYKCTNRTKWSNWWLALSCSLIAISFGLLVVSIVYPPFITSHLRSLVEPLSKSTVVIPF